MPPAAPALPKTPWRLVFAAALPAALHAVLLLGRLHPDEVYQVLEPGLHRAFGYGILAWEWQVGLRNWALPGLVALLLRGAEALGIHDAWARRAVVAVPQYFLHAAMLAAVWRLSARRVGPQLAKACVWLVALYGPVVWFGGRTLGEGLSTAFLVWGLERLDADEPGPRAGLLGGALLGFAEVARYGSAAVILPAMLWLVLSRRFKAFALAAAGGLAVALALGLLDKVTWGATLPNARLGGWWHSALEYLDFNVLSGRSAQQFGAEPWPYYAQRLAVAPFAAVGLLAWWRDREARAWLLAVPAAAYAVAISLTPHKEARFLYPALVLLTVAGAPAFARFAWRSFAPGAAAPPQTKVLLGAVAAAGLFYFAVGTPFDVERKDQFQLEAIGGRDATGFILVNEGLWGAGGHFYLGKNIPWFACDFAEDFRFVQAMRDPRFNRVVTYDDRALEPLLAAGFRVIQQRERAKLLGR